MNVLYDMADRAHSGICGEFYTAQIQAQILTGRADGVLVMCLGQHYVPVHKYLSLFIVIAPIYSHCTWMWSDGYIMHSDGYICWLDSCSTVPPS